MYIQITTRCNMSCEHCGMNCTHKGEDMSEEILKAALDLDMSSHVTIGGGEPTIHPKFKDFLFTCLGHNYVDYIWMITNGSMTETSIALARLSNEDRFQCALSQDCFHDEICCTVVDEFNRNNLEIRDNTESLSNAGRCDWGNDSCICSDIVIKTDGTIKGCGCDDAPVIGDVHHGLYHEFKDYWEIGECCKDQEEPEEEDEGLTEEEVTEMWENNILPLVVKAYESDGVPDRPARRESFNNYTDQLCNECEITEDQYDEYCYVGSLPFD